MTLLTTAHNVSGLLPAEYGALVTEPVRRLSVALHVANVVTTQANTFRIPVLKDDAGAAWVAEGSEITPDDAKFDEIIVTPKKVAGLSILSRELVDDSDPAAHAIVGESLAQSIAHQIDAAFFGASIPNGPDGLLSLVDGETPPEPLYQVVDTGGAIANLDSFAEALSLAEGVGAQATSFVANPATVLALSKLKRETGSNEPLLGADPTAPTKRTILGVPLVSSPAVSEAAGVWAIPVARVVVVLREDVRVDVDRSAYFSSDRIGVRATLRVGFGFPSPKSIVRIHEA